MICVCLVYSYLNDNHEQKVKEFAEEVMEDRGDEVPVWLSSEQKPVPAGYPVLRNFEPDIDSFYEDWLGKKGPDRRQRQRRCGRSDERAHRVVGRA